jgi:hypothetical protein
LKDRNRRLRREKRRGKREGAGRKRGKCGKVKVTCPASSCCNFAERRCDLIFYIFLFSIIHP